MYNQNAFFMPKTSVVEVCNFDSNHSNSQVQLLNFSVLSFSNYWLLQVCEVRILIFQYMYADM